MRHAYSTGVAMGLSILLAFSGVSRAQVRANLLTLAELTELDAGFHKEMDAAQEAFDREAFGDAEGEFSQLAQEIEATIKRISVSTPPKNSFLEIDGVKQPVTIQTETEWFTRTLNSAQQKKNAAGILRKVTDIQKQAADLLSAGKYPEDCDAYQESADLLAENRSQIDDGEFKFFAARSENGRRQSVTTFWAKQFGALRDRYNRTTEDSKMSPEEIRQTIRSVADEIVSQGYADPLKHPDMPDDARALFHNLLGAANQYLGSQ
jgi:hypothetical protein